MTALTVPANLEEDARLRPVPWRRMAWVTWRQHRFALGGVTVLLGAFAVYLREHYMAPLITSRLNPPGSAWVVSQWYAKDGRFAFPSRGSQLVSALSRYCPGNFDGSPAQCLSRHGYTQWSSYQPGSRFWPFQWIEGGWLLALSVLLIAASVWLVRRRAA